MGKTMAHYLTFLNIGGYVLLFLQGSLTAFGHNS